MKRAWVYTTWPSGAPVGALKLGRKKLRALYAVSALPWKRMAAVPVAEAESRMTGPKEPNRLVDSPSHLNDSEDAS